MKEVVLDASVVAKWFIEEQDTEKALQVRDLYVDGKIGLITPVLILFELGNVLRKHPSFSIEDSERALEAFLNLKIDLRSFVEPTLLKKTYRLSKDLGITFYDASYLALARSLKLVLLTGDNDLYNKAVSSDSVALLSNLKVDDFTI